MHVASLMCFETPYVRYVIIHIINSSSGSPLTAGTRACALPLQVPLVTKVSTWEHLNISACVPTNSESQQLSLQGLYQELVSQHSGVQQKPRERVYFNIELCRVMHWYEQFLVWW